jgi:hypothetical protein
VLHKESTLVYKCNHASTLNNFTLNYWRSDVMEIEDISLMVRDRNLG